MDCATVKTSIVTPVSYSQANYKKFIKETGVSPGEDRRVLINLTDRILQRQLRIFRDHSKIFRKCRKPGSSNL